MASSQDWARAAAEYILRDAQCRHNAERVVAILDAFSKPMTTLLRQAKREHYYPPCPKSNEHTADAPCTCNADAWNAKIDAMLSYCDLIDVSTMEKSEFIREDTYDGVFWTGPDTYVQTKSSPRDRALKKSELITIEADGPENATAMLRMMKDVMHLGQTIRMTFFGQEVELVVTKVKRS